VCTVGGTLDIYTSMSMIPFVTFAWYAVHPSPFHWLRDIVWSLSMQVNSIDGFKQCQGLLRAALP